MDGLFTNSSSRQDFASSFFAQYTKTPCAVRIAVAFFTDADQLLRLAQRRCTVKLVVRLGYPTKPDQLRKILNIEGLQVRYVTSEKFHPKLYIFYGRGAVVGSANLTKTALGSNQEVCVSLNADDERYDELMSLFEEYWNDARVLDRGTLEAYEKLYRKHQEHLYHVDCLRGDLEASVGKVHVQNIYRGEKRATKKETYLEDYRSDYQPFLDAYRTVRRLYEAHEGKKGKPKSRVPIHMEIDGFLNFIKESKVQNEEALHTVPELVGQDLSAKIDATLDEWFRTDAADSYAEKRPDTYIALNRVLDSIESIERASYEELVDVIARIHSFWTRRWRFSGGHEAHVDKFKKSNNERHLKRFLIYLLHGEDDFVDRLARCTHDSSLKPRDLGKSGIGELLGWVNTEDIPICNGRSRKALRWLGFGVNI